MTSEEDARANFAWLREYGSAYPGQWVALRGGRLVDSDKSRFALHERLGEESLLDGTLFVRLDDKG